MASHCLFGCSFSPKKILVAVSIKSTSYVLEAKGTDLDARKLHSMTLTFYKYAKELVPYQIVLGAALTLSFTKN